MPKVDLIATKDFKYNTRRLVAGEPFQARHSMDAMILTKVRKVALAPAPKSIERNPYIPAKPVSAAVAASKPPAAPKPAAKKAPAKRKAAAKK